MLQIGKLEAANRQLDFAIRLFFSCGDPVCVHTLAGAASIVLTDLVEHHAPSKSWDRNVQAANALSASDYFNIVRNAQNFLKHARGDPKAILNFNEVETEELLMLAVMNSGKLQHMSMEQSVYQLWYLGRRVKELGAGFPFVQEAMALFPGIEGGSPAKAKEVGQQILLAQLAAKSSIS